MIGFCEMSVCGARKISTHCLSARVLLSSDSTPYTIVLSLLVQLPYLSTTLLDRH